jgi:hypothetical protein
VNADAVAVGSPADALDDAVRAQVLDMTDGYWLTHDLLPPRHTITSVNSNVRGIKR